MQFLSRLMFMLAGLANLRLPGKPNKCAIFRQMPFSSRFMFMLVGFIKHRGCRNPGKTVFRVSFGRSSQLSPAESSTSDCLFVIDLLMGSTNEILNENRNLPTIGCRKLSCAALRCLSKLSSRWSKEFFLKGLGHKMGSFCWTIKLIKLNQYFLYMRSWFWNFQPILLKRKIIVKFMLASFKKSEKFSSFVSTDFLQVKKI